jgi:hypothetical protein
MRVLLDENMPTKFYRWLTPHDARTVAFMGWSSLKNGDLIREAAAAGFEAILTLDKNIRFQQNPQTLPFPIIEVDVRRDGSELAQLIALQADILRLLATSPRPGFHRVP